MHRDKIDYTGSMGQTLESLVLNGRAASGEPSLHVEHKGNTWVSRTHTDTHTPTDLFPG